MSLDLVWQIGLGSLVVMMILSLVVLVKPEILEKLK
jgi:hypothetical protein